MNLTNENSTANPMKHRRGNWFSLNPIKTISALLFIALLLIIIITEKSLSVKNGYWNKVGNERYVRLRELPPLYSSIVRPDDAYMKGTDSLVQKGYDLETDENGFIVPSAKYSKPDKSIVFLGGSTTECIYVEQEKRFPYLVGQILERNTGLKINSYNSGVSGNNTLHSLNILLNKLIPLHPDVVVLMENVNDLTLMIYEGSLWNNNPTKSPIVVPKKTILELLIPNLYQVMRGYLYRLLPQLSPDEFASIRGKRLEFDKNKLVIEFEMNLQTFIDICRARHIVPVLMTQESRLVTPPDPLIAQIMLRMERDNGITLSVYKDTYDLFNQTIRDVGKKNGVTVVDLAKRIPQTNEYMYDFGHFNDKGSMLAAEIISQNIRSLLSQQGS